MIRFIFLLLFALILKTQIAISQTFTMVNGSVSSCTGTFLDPGGTGNYGNSQTFVYTICPSTPGGRVIVTFTSFNTEANFDFLQIYDGNSTLAPSLGTFSGTVSPGVVQATVGNTSGCLTFRFTSDGSVVSTGWAATISCSTPCQTINAVLNSTVPAAGAFQIQGLVLLTPGISEMEQLLLVRL